MISGTNERLKVGIDRGIDLVLISDLTLPNLVRSARSVRAIELVGYIMTAAVAALFTRLSNMPILFECAWFLSMHAA